MNLKRRWQNYYKLFIGRDEYFSLSPSHIALRKLIFVIKNYCRDKKVLDVGAGEMTFDFLIKPIAREYVTLDKYATHPNLNIVADAEDMPIKDEDFEVIFCSQVLEHVLNPRKVLNEITRVLKKNGIVIISVPHLSYIHGEPDDFFRYTYYALDKLCAEVGLKKIKIMPIGGILSFIFTPVSILFLSLFGFIPILGVIARKINYLFSKIIFFIDEQVDKNKNFALNYIGVFKKIN